LDDALAPDGRNRRAEIGDFEKDIGLVERRVGLHAFAFQASQASRREGARTTRVK
jgi:hypothetical protein